MITKKTRRGMLKHIINQYYVKEMLISLLENNYMENEICGELIKMMNTIRREKK